MPMTDPPAPPDGHGDHRAGLLLGPDGATFNPAITLTVSYDPAKLPSGVQEKNLIMATWDTTAGKWVDIQTTVDAVAHTASASIGHFSSFAIIVHTRPAFFAIGGLSVSPAEVNPGDKVSVGASVTNSGDLAGTYPIKLKVNGTSESTQGIAVAGGGSQSVSFTIARDAPGTYQLDINGLSGTFIVRSPAALAIFNVRSLAISPSEVNLGGYSTVSVIVENTGDAAGDYTVTLKINGAVVEKRQVNLAAHTTQTEEFHATGEDLGTFEVDVNGLLGSLTVLQPVAAVPNVSKINWWLIGGLIALLLAIVMVAWLAIRRPAA